MLFSPQMAQLLARLQSVARKRPPPRALPPRSPPRLCGSPAASGARWRQGAS